MKKWILLGAAIAVTAGALCFTGRESADSTDLVAAVEKFAGGVPQQVAKGRRSADSKDIVFLLQDAKSVVKAFTDSQRFSDCRAALERFNSFNLLLSVHPQVLATAHCKADGNRYCLVQMSFVSGAPLTKLIYDPVNGPVSARRLGEALAELHGHVQEFTAAVPESHRTDLVSKVQWLPVESQRLVSQLVAAVSSVRVQAVPLHGDVTLKNVLYDALADQLAFVDLGSSPAFGCAEQDYTQVEHALLSLDPARLAKGKKEELLRAFEEGYNRPLHPSVHAFYQLRRACDRLRDFELHKGRWKSTEDEAFFTARRDAALGVLERLAGA